VSKRAEPEGFGEPVKDALTRLHHTPSVVRLSAPATSPGFQPVEDKEEAPAEGSPGPRLLDVAVSGEGERT
jgi:hypothetical protein